MKNLAIPFALTALVLALGCESPTKPAPDQDPGVTSTVWQLSPDGASGDLTLRFDAPSGRTLTAVNVEWAFDTTILADTSVNGGWQPDGTWSGAAAVPEAADTWSNTNWSGTGCAYIELKVWNASGTLAIRSVNFTYDNGDTEVLTFQTGASPFHYVLTPTEGEAVVADLGYKTWTEGNTGRFYMWCNNTTPQEGAGTVTTVAF